LRDGHRSGRPSIFNPAIHAKVIYLAANPPFDDELKGFSNITSELIAWVMQQRQWVDSISRETIRNILRTHRLQVHRVKYWKTSTDPNFLEKMRRIVELYLHPPTDTLIICVDEMPTLQALERIEHAKGCSSGKLRRVEFEYKRHGTTNLFAALDVTSGQLYGETKETKKHLDFLSFMENVDAHWNYQQMKVIIDNYSTHKHQLVKEWIKNQNGRIEFVFTPFHGSWLNQIEIWFGILRRYSLKNVSVKSVEELNSLILAFIDTWNKNFAHPFKWKFKGW
jgi:transposase